MNPAPDIGRPAGVTFLEIARAANAQGLHLIHNGREIVVSPILLPGWHKVGVMVREPASNQEGAP